MGYHTKNKEVHILLPNLTYICYRKKKYAMWGCDTSLLAFSHSSSVFCLGFQKAAYGIQNLPTVFKIWIYRKESTLANLRRQGFLCHYFFTTNTSEQVFSWLLTCSTRSWPVKKDTYMYERDKLQATDDVTQVLDDFQGFGLQRGWSSNMPSRTICLTSQDDEFVRTTHGPQTRMTYRLLRARDHPRSHLTSSL